MASSPPSSDPFRILSVRPESTPLDAAGLEEKLRRNISGEVRFDPGSRALYATDGSNYRQVPIGIVLPLSAQDVIAAVSLCREFGAPLLNRGGGTSLAGQCCNVAVILDFSKYMARILEIDPRRKLARVEPGVILDHLRAAAERHHLTFGPDPATHDRCTLGGMIGNNSCGVHSVMAGKTDDNIEELDVLTYDGTRLRVGATSPDELDRIVARSGRPADIYARLKSIADRYGQLVREKFPDIPRRVSGYNLNFLLPENGFHVARALVGSEGTCATVLEATCKLVESPPERVLVAVAYPDIYQCADHVPEVMSFGPIGLEGVDDLLVEFTRRKGINLQGLALLPQGKGFLLAEFGGDTQAAAESQARRMMDALARSAHPPELRLFTDKTQQRKVWDVRESSLGVISHVPGEPLTWEGWEDSAVSPEKLGSYLRDLRRLMNDYQYLGVLYGHFGHACVHTRISFDLQSEAGIARFRRFMEEAAALVLSYGGSLSGEHGDGQARAELLPRMFGPELVQAFREFKSAWDPDWKMNPGKVVDPYRMDENLRLGAGYSSWEPPTHFAYPEDHGSLARATLRCVGVGKCRHYEGGIMCPSFRVTREEQHSTRGRAHLLFEMMQRDVIAGGWRDENVKDSLDLCLACKGCKSDCPVHVDVATYKAEFLAQYYDGRSRPLNAYAFGNIDLWARAAEHVPGLANLATQLPVARDIAKLLAGIPRERSIPAFAPQTFRRWFTLRQERRQLAHGNLAANPSGHGSRRVILWADTFNNYFLPQTAQAAVAVLESAGFRVLVPRRKLCCGRPLYDFGMLDRAKRLLLEILDHLALEIEAGTPVVGLEPSCAAVFRDELPNLFPADPRALKLSSQTYVLSEFLQKHAADFELPRLPRKALLHGHCHHKAIMKMTDEEAVLARMGVDFHSPAPGCCGMAGSFGFERHKYEISAAIGELDLLPAVRSADPETLIVADGFSCREQIAQGTGRQALHLAQVIAMAMDGASRGPHPESPYVETRARQVHNSMQRAAWAVAGLAAGAALWGLSRK